MPGPGRNSLGRPGPKAKDPGKMFKRIMGYVFDKYLLHYAVVIICIIISVASGLQGTLFMKELIDKYITPYLLDPNKLPNYAPLAKAITRVACFYALGVAANFTQQKLLITITQGTMQTLRNDLFGKMEKLPIKYFDTHTTGDIMSVYTNDIDTMRQMISQSIPQCINSVITIISVLHRICSQKQRKAFCTPAETARYRQRFHRGNDHRSEGGQGILSRRSGN